MFRKPTIEQLEGFIQPTWQALVDGSKHVDERLREIFDEVSPDVIVEDNVVGFAAVVTADRPWIRVMSCNPLELPDPGPAAGVLGLPDGRPLRLGRVPRGVPAGPRRTCTPTSTSSCRSAAARRCPSSSSSTARPYLNLFLYPEEADYPRSRPLGPMWERLDSCVRTEGHDLELPKGDGPLVYLSLGSLGSADVELMQRLVDLLAAGGYRAIVSKGPQHEQIELRDGQVGAELVPQPALLPLVDAVITHGGNNTVTECLHFGKPMVLLPLFWDQYDNAQRMHELGLGVRLPTFTFEDGELGAAIDGLVADDALKERLKGISRRLQDSPGTEKAADCIESVRGSEPRARARA